MDRNNGVLVGATVAGPSGGEVLGLLTLAVHVQIPIGRLRQMIYAYAGAVAVADPGYLGVANPEVTQARSTSSAGYGVVRSSRCSRR